MRFAAPHSLQNHHWFDRHDNSPDCPYEDGITPFPQGSPGLAFVAVLIWILLISAFWVEARTESVGQSEQPTLQPQSKVRVDARRKIRRAFSRLSREAQAHEHQLVKPLLLHQHNRYYRSWLPLSSIRICIWRLTSVLYYIVNKQTNSAFN
jgi:hypothetical protein